MIITSLHLVCWHLLQLLEPIKFSTLIYQGKIAGSCNDLAIAIVDCGESLQSLKFGKCTVTTSIRIIRDNLLVTTILNELFKIKDFVDLSISYCVTGALEPLAEGLACCSQLMKLNISKNAIGSEGIVSLSKRLQFCLIY